MTLYETLGIEADASAGDIKRAWRAAARRFHPDRHPDDDNAATQFKAASAAYEILGDPNKRHLYDLSVTVGPGCSICGDPVVGNRELCMMCGLRAYQRSEAQKHHRRREAHRARQRAAATARLRQPKPSPPPPPRARTYEEEIEEQYAWIGNPDNFDHMMGDRSPADFRTTGVSSDELLGALLSEGAIRAARAQASRRRPGVSVVIQVNNLRVEVDANTIGNMRKMHRSLTVAQSLFRRVRGWME